ncbi:MAG TPA: NAD(P)-dependent oxidoreductase [Pseudonocardiaceae bacterium]|nr:NAD(P)-dependent oxidoreductase [Pseudonocardiaceae bacterium]
MTTVFLAGATGVLGRRIVSLLVARGHEVTALTRSPAGADLVRSLGAEAVLGDALDAESVRAAVLAAAPDVVMHQLTDLATRNTAANAALRINGTRNLVDAALAAGVSRFVVQSIAWAYEPGDKPAIESTPLDLRTEEPRLSTVEGIAALESQAARVPEHVVLRYGLLYGPDTWYAPDGAMADAARAGQLAATGDVTSFVHIDDAAAAAIRALDWPTGAVNVCDDEPAEGVDWVPVFCDLVGASAPATSTERTPFARGADNTHARQELGWQPAWPSWRNSFGQSPRSV